MRVSILYHDLAVHCSRGRCCHIFRLNVTRTDSRDTNIPQNTMPSLRAHFRQWIEARRLRRITPEQARQRVARGADYLDEEHPGWHQHIDPSTLELSEGSCCVLGQLHGDFRLGLARASVLDLSSAPRANLSPVDLGFLCIQGVAEVWQAQDYRNLNQAWQGEVVRRRQAQWLTQVPGQLQEAKVHTPPEPARPGE